MFIYRERSVLGWWGEAKQSLSRLQGDWMVLGRKSVALHPVPLCPALVPSLGPSSPDLGLQKPQKLKGKADP